MCKYNFETKYGDTVKTYYTPTDSRDGFRMSIRKWEYILNELKNGYDIEYDGCTDTCGLCILYHKYVNGRANCKGCPVKEKTGRNGCRNTPYDKWSEVRFQPRENKISVAEQELNFLKSLYKEIYK